MHPFLQRFKRITYSTSYLPEIDGLRFLAIFLVVAVMHIPNYINVEYCHHQLLNTYWTSLSVEGGRGVDLFFMVSGFILSLPFAKMYLLNGKKVLLKNYYLRRVTRLEPPYIIALVIFFIANVWVLHKYSFQQLLPDFFSSAFYVNGPLFHRKSQILPIAWSLEVEVQFYLLAPLFFTVFLIRKKEIRWLLYSIIIVAGTIYWFDDWAISNVFKALKFFFAGIFLADLYCDKVQLIKNEKLGLAFGLIALLGIFFIHSLHSAPEYLLKIACMFLLFHLVLTNTLIKKIFSNQWLTVIGGMCYSIYLMHLAVVSLIGKAMAALSIDVANKTMLPLLFIIFIMAVLILSSLYFLLIEKPFMKPIGIRKAFPQKQQKLTSI